jgi:hypothetical protein
MGGSGVLLSCQMELGGVLPNGVREGSFGGNSSLTCLLPVGSRVRAVHDLDIGKMLWGHVLGRSMT